jgi:hypothetical protein
LCFADPNLEITTIIGKGIKKEIIDRNYEPTAEDVEKYHKLYVDELIRIYDKYKILNDNKPLAIY